VSREKGEDAVSPVVGVMLMLVVTLIIAAVVSGFAGGLIKGTKESPDLTMEVHIVNTGTYLGSGFYATVLGSSEAISTSDLKLVTTWSTTDKDSASSTYGKIIHGGNTSAGGIRNVGYTTYKGAYANTAPYGYGTGAGTASAQNPTLAEEKPNEWFGNYSLIQGTSMKAYPAGLTSGQQIGASTISTSYTNGGYGSDGTKTALYNYTYGSNFAAGQIDPTTAVLGGGWQNLRAGDTVNVKVIFVPTGQAIYKKEVSVTEG
jgi:archaeal type IV pilus assembly protein PilA